MKNRIVILASGGGSNANAILEYFEHNPEVEIVAIISNKKEAGVHQVAAKHHVSSYYFSKDQRMAGEMMEKIMALNPDLIVLAGYLLKIPKALIEEFPNKIINIHPALLPNYGGKGMYGMNVHRAVAKAGDKLSGITIHFVNENYDEGHVINQFSCTIDIDYDADKIQQTVLKLEHKHYPRVIEDLLKK